MPGRCVRNRGPLGKSSGMRKALRAARTASWGCGRAPTPTPTPSPGLEGEEAKPLKVKCGQRIPGGAPRRCCPCSDPPSWAGCSPTSYRPNHRSHSSPLTPITIQAGLSPSLPWAATGKRQVPAPAPALAASWPPLRSPLLAPRPQDTSVTAHVLHTPHGPAVVALGDPALAHLCNLSFHCFHFWHPVLNPDHKRLSLASPDILSPQPPLFCFLHSHLHGQAAGFTTRVSQISLIPVTPPPRASGGSASGDCSTDLCPPPIVSTDCEVLEGRSHTWSARECPTGTNPQRVLTK